MPKQVDHDQRREQIAEALWRIAADRGLEAVSMREVATEAGISIGLVQHYFGSKDQMVAFATSRLRGRIDQRIRQRVAATPQPRTALALLRAILVALLPMNPESRMELLVGNAVFIRALADAKLVEQYLSGLSQLTGAVAEQVTAAVGANELRADLDPELEADVLLATVRGLASDLLLGHHDPDRAMAILDHQLGRLAAP
jgi:TetR/AcrR family transcriptional regulator, transcriptional repressor of bet genes